MRGKRYFRQEDAMQGRITPAHAGKTPLKNALHCVFLDHPRACGENLRPGARACRASGSPPRMRGKQTATDYNAYLHRITPAHAGKTFVFGLLRPAPRDHPRACGENRDASNYSAYIRGSPPRMRGKRCHRPSAYACHGITPAHAGKTK